MFLLIWDTFILTYYTELNIRLKLLRFNLKQLELNEDVIYK